MALVDEINSWFDSIPVRDWEDMNLAEMLAKHWETRPVDPMTDDEWDDLVEADPAHYAPGPGLYIAHEFEPGTKTNLPQECNICRNTSDHVVHIQEPTKEDLAYAFYGGIPWDKLTLFEQKYFEMHLANKNKPFPPPTGPPQPAPTGRVDISFSWSWQSKDVVDLSVDGLYLDEYESDDLFIALRDALNEWLTSQDDSNLTGAERYMAERRKDPEFEAMYQEAMLEVRADERNKITRWWKAKW